MTKAATATARYGNENPIGKLAKFFPNAMPLRIPVRLTRMTTQGKPSVETTVVEFGTSHEVLFASSLPLEFADMLRLQNSEGTLDTEACVVALQYNGGRTAVAARFKDAATNWIVKQ
ncbi:MAG: hypothetical protein ACRD2S_00470 [Terriglobales bacterium]